MSRALPSRYPFREHVPSGKDGGARCSTCHYLSKDGKRCRNKFFIEEAGTKKLKDEDGKVWPSDVFCCSAWSAEARN